MDPVSRLPLNALRVFVALAQKGSMRGAAEALNVQPSAVSMQVKNLNDYLGVPLLAKSGRGVELTHHGIALLPGVLAGLTQIDDAVKSLRQSAFDRPFTLSVLGSYLQRWLVPRLPSFEAAHPHFKLQILSSPLPVNLARGDADAAVRLGPGRWPGVNAEKLMDEWLVPACTPALARRIGQLKRGELPQNVKLLESAEHPWSMWTGCETGSRSPHVMIDDALALVTAAESALGLGLLRWSLICDAVADGRLVVVGHKIPHRFAYYWVRAADRAGRATSQTHGHELHLWLRQQSQRH
jgi:LysR family glycine cleavage system transcriptional activator